MKQGDHKIVWLDAIEQLEPGWKIVCSFTEPKAYVETHSGSMSLSGTAADGKHVNLGGSLNMPATQIHSRIGFICVRTEVAKLLYEQKH